MSVVKLMSRIVNPFSTKDATTKEMSQEMHDHTCKYTGRKNDSR